MTVYARTADAVSHTAIIGWLAALAAAALLVLTPSSAVAEEAGAGRAYAPIVYGKPASRTQTERVELAGFQNAATPAAITGLYSPQAESLPPLADVSRTIEPRTQNGVNAFASAGAIDLRPGAARVEPVAFAPSAPAASPTRAAVSPFVEQAARAIPAPAPSSAYAEPVAGAPYQVEGRWYVPMHEPGYDEVGVASWYGPTFHGKAAANGEIFDEMAMTAAHPTLPLPSLVRVTNLENGKSIVVRLNDRGPFVDDRIIDLSKGAALALEMHRQGTAKVRVQYVGPAPKEHNAAPSGAPVQVALRTEDVAAFDTRPAPAAMSVAAPAPDTRPAERRLPVADPVDARPRAAAPVSGGQGGVMLQAGSFADLGNAHKLRDQLSTLGLGGVTVRPVQVNGSEFYRVMVGPWASRTDAERAQQIV